VKANEVARGERGNEPDFQKKDGRSTDPRSLSDTPEIFSVSQYRLKPDVLGLEVPGFIKGRARRGVVFQGLFLDGI